MNKMLLMGFLIAGMVVGFQGVVSKVYADVDLSTVQNAVNGAQDINNLVNSTTGSGSGGSSTLQQLIKTITLWAMTILLAIIGIMIGVSALKMANGQPGAIGGLVKGIIAAVVVGALGWLIPFLTNIGLNGH